ncbi:MAG: recombinase family protein [Chitinophaga sp.]|uniref:recombinase family protein n=1 Tax=Chitinophaga sp. TaxID=1869181 RepID=UPI0025BC0242|nr:recombinase family protein [Chitinophaga sp.]MBV8254840.1 recombinase family protein [Chitinophaga sp.]
MKNAILYTRVSTDDQAAYGFSLDHQKETLTKYCQIKNITILKHYQEDYSAKDFNRPEWKKMTEYIKHHKKEVDYILFTRWDRFTRNIDDSFSVINQFKKQGILLDAVEQPLDLSNPENYLLLTVYITSGYIEREKIKKRTKDAMRIMRKQGKWAGTAPLGYKYHREDARTSSLTINDEKADFIRDAFKMYSTGLYSIPEVQKTVTKKHAWKRPLSKQAFINILKNKVYAGYVKIEATADEEAHYARGQHPAIIQEKLFDDVQKLLKGRKRTKNIRQQDQRHPLRGFMRCPTCKKNMTSSAVKNRRFVYYQCQEGHHRYNALGANEKFENLLIDTFSVDDHIITCYQQILENTFDKNGNDVKKQIKTISKQIEDCKRKLDSKEDDYVNDRILAEAYNSVRRKLTDLIDNLTADKAALESDLNAEFKTYLSKSTVLLKDLAQWYIKADVEVKRRILNVILDDKLTFENDCYQTPKYTPAVDVLLRINKDLQAKKNGSGKNPEPLSSSAPPAGLEPATL